MKSSLTLPSLALPLGLVAQTTTTTPPTTTYESVPAYDSSYSGFGARAGDMEFPLAGTGASNKDFDSSGGGIAASLGYYLNDTLATLLSLVFITSLASHRFARFEKLISGEPTLLVAHGRLLQASLNRERIAPSELHTEMHNAGLERLEQVRWAILECNGRIAIIPVPGADPGA